MVHAGTLLLGGLSPTMVEAVLQHCGALPILLPLFPPTCLRPAAGGTVMRITSATMGQDLTWLLRDAGPTVSRQYGGPCSPPQGHGLAQRGLRPR